MMDNIESNQPQNGISDGDRQAAKIDTNTIPKPMPAGTDPSTSEPAETPLTEDTIAIKKPIPSTKPQAPLSFGDAEEVAPEPVEEQEPERRLKIFCYNCGQKLDLTDMESFSKVECPSCSGAIIVPRWWDNYLLEEQCGIGGMAEVFRGLDLALDREVAIKILNNEIANDADRNKLFLHEARTAATLNHYAILPIYTCGEYENQAYFVMQYMGGGSLELELETETPLSTAEAVKWMKDICEGLDNARRHGIIHHDIKPGNFMLDEDRNVKIGDFGISQALHDSRAEEVNELTKHWGSPDYVSPEKISTGKESYLGDIYSLGASFYHLLSGETPFDCIDTAELLKTKTIKDPIDIRKLREDVPAGLADLLTKMMDRTPEARPSYRDIIAELNAFGKAGTKKKKTTGVQQKAPTQTKTSINLGKKGKVKNMDMSKYGIKKKNPVMTLVKIVAVLAILLVGYLAWSQGFLDSILKNFMPSAVSDAESDHLPRVTKLISEGKSEEAASLAQITLDSPLAELDEVKQAAMQSAICNFLNNETDAYDKCSVLEEKLVAKGVDKNSSEVAIINYLSSPSLTPDSLRNKLINEGGLKMAGEVAVYVKEIYNDGDDKTKKSALREYANLSTDVSASHWATGWGDRIQKWYNWSFRGTGDEDSLEPLIKKTKATVAMMPEDDPNNSNSTNTNNTSNNNTSSNNNASTPDPSTRKVSELTIEWLKNNRSFADKRPKPDNFNITESSVQSYLASLSGSVQYKESQRAEQIIGMKATLCKKMFRKPFKGSLVTKSGDRISGTMIGNARSLMVRSPGKSPKKVNWEEFHIDQFIKVLYFYAKDELSMNPKQAAQDYVRIAIICDWYGRNKNTVTFANKAVDADPEIEKFVTGYLLD